MKETFDATIKVLTETTSAIREDYIKRYTELELHMLVTDRAGLAAVGMDAQIYAPYPNGNMNRSDYRQAKAKHDRVRRYFKCQAITRGWKDPEIVAENPDAEPRLRAAATEAANAEVDSYLYKMAAKIGKVVTSATTNGRIWDYAYLNIVCEDGEQQQWKTQCIINRSVYNKLFNQWPTRRVA